MDQVFSTVDVSRVLNIPEHRIAYALRAGYLPEPSIRVGNKRVFTQADLVRVAEYFGVAHRHGKL